MTDDLDQDLRTMLAVRAGTVTVDAAAGEQAVADRLLAGDHALADVVPLTTLDRHRGRWLAAAAAVVVALVGGALVLRNDDEPVHTGPAATAPSDSTEWIVQGTFVDSTQADAACSSRPGVGETYAEGASESSAGGTAAGPSERLFLRVVGRSAADDLATCLSDHGGTDVAVEPYVAPTVPSAADDPLVAQDGESAKDVAERVAGVLFHDTYVTTSVAPADPTVANGRTGSVVTMEGSAHGDTLLGYVVEDAQGRPRLSVLTNPALDGHLITHMTNDELFAVELPSDGHLTMSGLASDLSPLGVLDAEVVNHNADVSVDWWTTARLVTYELVTADGTVLRALQPTPSSAG